MAQYVYYKEKIINLRKEKPGKFRGEGIMLMYITTSEMLQEGRMQEILHADTKKERKLCLFCKKDDTFSFEDVAGLLPAAKKMEILPKCCASSEDMLLQIGMMAAQKKNSDSVFTVLPTEEFDETLSLYGIERYDRKTQKTSTGSVKRQSRKRKENEKPRAVQTISDCDPMMDTSMNPPVSLHVKTDEKIDPADDLAGEDIPRPSIPDNSTDRKIFLSILEMKASDAGFDGTDEKFALAIADCMEQFEINKRPLKPAIFQKFGEENGEKVYNQLKEKYVYLVNSLTCKKQEK